MPGALDLIKTFQLSKMNVYFDGDPMPYIMSVKVPPIIVPKETFDNTSTGGPIEVGDPNRKYVDGEGEVKYEQDDVALIAKLSDASKLQNLRLAIAANALNPQLGIFMPQPMEYGLAVQFIKNDPGVLQQGTKREATANFLMFNMKVKIATGAGLITVVDYDFVNSSFKIENTDVLATVTALI